MELIVSELFSNALRHGDGKIEVRLSRTANKLRIGVHDHGDSRPVAGKPQPDDEQGRGLPLISAMIEPYSGTITVTADEGGPGKTVHVTITIDGEDSPWPGRQPRPGDRRRSRRAACSCPGRAELRTAPSAERE